MMSTSSWKGLAGGTSRKSTCTLAVPGSVSHSLPDSTTDRVIVVPGAPASKVMALVPWPLVIVPPVSVHVYVEPAWNGTDAGMPEAPTPTEPATVMVGAVDAPMTVVAVAVLLPGFASAADEVTLAVLTAELDPFAGVITIVIGGAEVTSSEGIVQVTTE